MHEWLANGKKPPSAPRIERTQSGDPEVDAFGNPVGGYRLPVVDVPVATYTSGCAPLYGQTDQLSETTLKALYPTHEEYVAELERSIDETIDKGWLLPFDAKDLRARARTSPIPETE